MLALSDENRVPFIVWISVALVIGLWTLIKMLRFDQLSPVGDEVRRNPLLRIIKFWSMIVFGLESTTTDAAQLRPWSLARKQVQVGGCLLLAWTVLGFFFLRSG